MADEEQEQLEDGWQAKDLRSGVAQVYAEAKRKSTMGIRVGAIWAVVAIVYGVLDMSGVVTVAPPVWDVAAGLGVVLLMSLSISRTPNPMLAAAVVILVDLVIVAYRLPALSDMTETGDTTAAAIRVVLAPIALFFVLSGYLGCLSIQAFKRGFSPGADWRTRINPMMMQVVVVGSCVVAVLLGVGTWFGAIRAGFARTDAIWETRERVFDPIVVETAKPKVKGAKDKRKGDRGILDVILMREPEEEDDSKPPVYPENAGAITTTEGLDAYAKRQVEEAFEFGRETDQAGCLLEGHGRQDRCRDERCRYWARIFVRACLPKAKETEKFCDDVPEPTAEQSGTLWAQDMCAGRKFETCREILYGVQGHCHSPDDVMASWQARQAERAKAEKEEAEKEEAAKAAAAEKEAAKKEAEAAARAEADKLAAAGADGGKADEGEPQAPVDGSSSKP